MKEVCRRRYPCLNIVVLSNCRVCQACGGRKCGMGRCVPAKKPQSSVPLWLPWSPFCKTLNLGLWQERHRIKSIQSHGDKETTRILFDLVISTIYRQMVSPILPHGFITVQRSNATHKWSLLSLFEVIPSPTLLVCVIEFCHLNAYPLV